MFGIAMALLLLAGGADAGELLTPPLFVDELLAYIVTNVSSTARTCRIEVLNGMAIPLWSLRKSLWPPGRPRPSV